MKLFEKALGRLTAAFLILAGFVGITVIAADISGFSLPHLLAKPTEEIVLLMVSSLTLALGLERILNVRRYEERFQTIERLLAKHSSGQLLNGKAEIYDSAKRLCSGFQKQIRTLIFSAGPKAPKSFAKTINRRLRELTAAGTPGRFVAVVALNLGTLAKDFFERMDARRAIYASSGIEYLVPLYLLDTKYQLGFDVLIIDDQHVTIGFNTITGVGHLQYAICFENQPSLAKEFVDWFEHTILPSAVEYSQCRSNQETRTPGPG